VVVTKQGDGMSNQADIVPPIIFLHCNSFSVRKQT